jgi:CheY-like chemotaxis protein
VLVVDDEPRIRASVTRMLQPHEVVEAEDGAAAQRILEQDERFDIILCDMMMPDVSGMDLHAWLVERSPTLAERVIFVTGGAFTPRARSYLSHVDNLRLEKPFEVDAFRKLVDARMRLARQLPSSEDDG